jgi:AcrR family transcriptional regulator
VLADEGSSAKLDTIAEAAGVSRATLYRHFSSREELFAALVDAAYGEVVKRVRDADIDRVPFTEGLARVARAAALTSTQYVVLSRELVVARPNDPDDVYERTMRRLFERGKKEGVLRRELTTTWLREVFRGLVVTVAHVAAIEGLGTEQMAALIVEQFLSGSSAQSGRAA